MYWERCSECAGRVFVSVVILGFVVFDVLWLEVVDLGLGVRYRGGVKVCMLRLSGRILGGWFWFCLRCMVGL